MFSYIFSPEKGLHKNVEKNPRRRCLHGALGEVFRDQQRQDAAAPGIALGSRRGWKRWKKRTGSCSGFDGFCHKTGRISNGFDRFRQRTGMIHWDEISWITGKLWDFKWIIHGILIVDYIMDLSWIIHGI